MNDEVPLDLQDFWTHLFFKVYILPKSSKNAFAGKRLDALKIKLTAPPVEGSANKLCIEFLSGQLKVPKSSLTLVSGLSSRTKRVRYDPVVKIHVQTEVRRVKGLLSAFASPEKTT